MENSDGYELFKMIKDGTSIYKIVQHAIFTNTENEAFRLASSMKKESLLSSLIEDCNVDNIEDMDDILCEGDKDIFIKYCSHMKNYEKAIHRAYKIVCKYGYYDQLSEQIEYFFRSLTKTQKKEFLEYMSNQYNPEKEDKIYEKCTDIYGYKCR
jgi:hypothetical protein